MPLAVLAALVALVVIAGGVAAMVGSWLEVRRARRELEAVRRRAMVAEYGYGDDLARSASP